LTPRKPWPPFVVTKKRLMTKQVRAMNGDLDLLTIDDLRRLACTLDVPERSEIVEKAELIAEIRRRL
jgi:hypothetical protein